MTLEMLFATATWLLLMLGFFRRRNRHQHVPLVLSAILGDICLVLYLDFTRRAVATALNFELSTLQQLHIGLSSAALLLYFPILFSGVQLLKGREKFRTFHKKLAFTALCFRSLGFVFMFSMWKT